MAFTHNSSLGAWTYTALHGTYGLLWILKDRTFPDARTKRGMRIGSALILTGVLTVYTGFGVV